MREADLMWSRRRFLLTSVKASAAVGAGLVLGPEVFDYLDRLGPRRLMVPGVQRYPIYDQWKEVKFRMSDYDWHRVERGEIPVMVSEAKRALDESLRERGPSRVTLTREYNQTVIHVDALGVSNFWQQYSYRPSPRSLPTGGPRYYYTYSEAVCVQKIQGYIA